MLKKGIAAAALIAATSSVYAGGPEAPPAYIGGAYVDVGLSRDDLYDKFSRSQTIVSTTVDRANNVLVLNGPDQIHRIDAGAPGWDGFLGFGYTHVWNNEWTFGFEIFGDSSSSNGTQLQGNLVNSVLGAALINSLDLRAKYSLGVSLMPGYFAAPGSLFFLDLGYVNTEFSLRGFPNPYPGVSISNNPSDNFNRSGFRLGVGTNTQVGAHVAIRQEYVWEGYSNFTARSLGSTTTTNDQLGLTTTTATTHTARISPNNTKFNLAAVYYFARQGNAPDLNAAPAHVGGHFYAGLNGSYDEVYSHAEYWRVRGVSTSNVTNLVTADNYIADSGVMKITGWNVGLLAGYGWNFTNRWYLGGEIFGNYDDSDGRYDLSQGAQSATVNGTPIVVLPNTTSNIYSRLHKQWDFGVALIPGYQVSDNALLYGRVGYVGADFNLENIWTGATGLTSAQNQLLTRSRSKWLNGLQLGVGVDTTVYENLSLRTEFDINNYNNYTVSRQINAATVNGVSTVTTVSTTHRHPIEDQFNVALIWHFFG